MILFFQLVIGHALADFVLQTDTMAQAKDRHSDFGKSLGDNFPPWYYWLGAHALIGAACLAVFALGLVMAPKVAGTMEGYKLESLRSEEQRLLDERRALDLQEAQLLSPERLAILQCSDGAKRQDYFDFGL